jgi:hypothetical protein
MPTCTFGVGPLSLVGPVRGHSSHPPGPGLALVDADHLAISVKEAHPRKCGTQVAATGTACPNR